jgi:hypothetical protein
VNPKSTGILFLVAAALAAFVYFYEIRGEEGRREAEEAEKRLFSGFEAADVTAIALTSSDGVEVRAERQDGRWQIVAPLAFPADGAAFDAMAAALEQTASDTTLEDPQEPAVYGLDAEEREVRFRAGDAEHALRLGNNTPVGSATYVAVVGEPSIHTVPTYRTSAYARAFDDLREKRLLTFDREGVNRIEASWPGGRVELARGDDGWALLAPVIGPADEETVANLLSDLSYLRADGFVDEPPEDASAGLDRPAFAVRLAGSVPGEEGGAFEATVEIGNGDADAPRLVRGAQKSLYRIAAERLGDLPTTVVAYRFKQLAEFSPLDAQRVEILFHAKAGESVALTAERSGDAWTASPEDFEPGKLAALVGALANLRARDIAADAMGADELHGVELDPGNAIYRVFGAAAEGAEPALLADVRLGMLRGTDGVLAQRAGDDIVYVLDYAIAENVPVSYEAFENRFRATARPAAEPTAAVDDSEAAENAETATP